MTDFRALCAELTDTLDYWLKNSNLTDSDARDLIQNARTALNQPAPVLTDEELLELMPQQFRDDLATVSRLAAHGTNPDVTPGIFRVTLNTGALDYARAVLARWGNSQGILDSSLQREPASEEN